jgi:hypothetical protein
MLRSASLVLLQFNYCQRDAWIWFRLSIPGLSGTGGILPVFEDFVKEEMDKMSRRRAAIPAKINLMRR